MNATFGPSDLPGVKFKMPLKMRTPAANATTTPSPGSRKTAGTEKQIENLVAQIESIGSEDARTLLQECLQTVLALYGDALARILQLANNAGPEGKKVIDVLVRDKLIRSLLLVHGLHPQCLETRLQEALGKIRPYLQSHGGNVELLRLENDVATLRLQGTCKTCPSSAVTLELAVRQVIEEACPDLLGFEVENTGKPDPTAAPLVCDEKILAL